jgi:hypothetical protein
MAENDTQATPVQIRVLEGTLSVTPLQDQQPPGIIQLVGRALPLRGTMKFHGKQRVKTTFYPGNPVASQQVIGPTLEPTTFSGDLSDRYLGDGQAKGLVDLLDDLRARGCSVEVTWGGSVASSGAGQSVSGSPIVRVGVISDFAFTPDRIQDITWEATFDWRSAGQAAAPAISSTSKLNPRQDLGQVVDDLQMSSALWDAYRQGPAATVGVAQRLLQGAAQAQETIETAVDAILDASAAVATATLIPTQAALRMIGACTNGIAALTQLEQNLLAINPLASEVRDSALDLLRFKNDIFTQLLASRDAKERCYDARAGVQEIVEPDIIAEVVVTPGTDVRDLASKYYGDPELGWAIQNFNRFETSAVPPPATGPSDNPGRPVRIPRIQPGASSDLRAQC